jgi:hypothetical protein
MLPYIGALADRLSFWDYLVLQSIDAFFLFYGAYLWTKLKRRHWAWMFTMIFWPVGVLVLSMLKDVEIRQVGLQRGPKTNRRPVEVFLSQDQWLGKQIKDMSFREYVGMHLGRYSTEEIKDAYKKSLKAFSAKVRPVMENIIHDSVHITEEVSFWDKDCETVFHTIIGKIESHVPLFEGEWNEYDKDMIYLRILELFTLIVSLDLSENKTMREALGIKKIAPTQTELWQASK